MSQIVSALQRQHPGVRQISRLCHAVGISRATFYRYTAADRQTLLVQTDTDLELRHQLQQLALEFPGYGYRRMTKALQQQGFIVNHKRVLRLMREDNLLCLRRQAWITTTDSAHGLPVYPNLVPQLQLTGPDQLWIGDITYIRLRRGWVYLAVLLDAWSRRCIGWALAPHLRAELAVAALQMALAQRSVQPGLVHHSDQGVQYASTLYTHLLHEHGITISMSRRGCCWDNARAESFIKTLKYEEVYLQEYASLEEARESIGYFVEAVYNQKRLHSALGYQSPIAFEQQHQLQLSNHLN